MIRLQALPQEAILTALRFGLNIQNQTAQISQNQELELVLPDSKIMAQHLPETVIKKVRGVLQ